MSQILIPFIDVITEIEQRKQERKTFLEQHGFDSQDALLLNRITFDLTHKDFEYFIQFLLHKDGYDDFFVCRVKDYQDVHGNDLVWNKKDQKYYYQCKQWKDNYVSLKRLGEYYATIFHTKFQNPDAHFAFVTTSYVKSWLSLEFLEKHRIQYIWNKELLNWCHRYFLSDENSWKEMIEWIRTRRLMEDEGYRQKVQKIRIPYTPQELYQWRLQEFVVHLRPSRHTRLIDLHSISSEMLQQHSFFQYWNFV